MLDRQSRRKFKYLFGQCNVQLKAKYSNLKKKAPTKNLKYKIHLNMFKLRKKQLLLLKFQLKSTNLKNHTINCHLPRTVSELMNTLVKKNDRHFNQYEKMSRKFNFCIRILSKNSQPYQVITITHKI